MYKLPTLQELLEAGVHFGHQVRRGHPRMKPYIYGARDGVHIIDLTQSEKHLKEACELYIEEMGVPEGISSDEILVTSFVVKEHETADIIRT